MKLSLTLLMAIMTSLFYFYGVAQAKDIYAELKKNARELPFSTAITNLDISDEEKERFKGIVKKTELGELEKVKISDSDIINILNSVEIKVADSAAAAGRKEEEEEGEEEERNRNKARSKRSEIRFNGYLKALEDLGIDDKTVKDTGLLDVLRSLGANGFEKMKKEEYKEFIKKLKSKKLIESNGTTTTTTTTPYKSSSGRQKVGEKSTK